MVLTLLPAPSSFHYQKIYTKIKYMLRAKQQWLMVLSTFTVLSNFQVLVYYLNIYIYFQHVFLLTFFLQSVRQQQKKIMKNK